MKRPWIIALAAAALSLPAALLCADGPIPTDKQKKPPKKVITEDDLRSGGRPTRGTVSVGTPDTPSEPAAETKEPTQAASPAAAASPEPTDAEKRETLQKEIQGEIDYQSANIKTLQEQADKAQAELNDLTDLTFSAGQGTGRRGELMKLLDDAKAQMAASRQKIADLEEQARRAGVRVTVP